MIDHPDSPACPITGGIVLEEPIGAGGMATVWRATHRGHQLAVKVLTGEVARRPGFVHSFAEEVRATASLRHPAIVEVYDHGVIDSAQARDDLCPGSPWIAMEYLDGGALNDPGATGGWRRALALIRQLLEALAHAHARGVIHRDIKPSNILFDEHGQLRLTDFGLAHVTSDDRTSRDVQILGTPMYMAPEQIRGDFRQCGPWTDLYAVGCLVWAMTTGKPPFDHLPDTQSVLRAQLYHRPPTFRPRMATPAALDEWLLRALAKDPTRRFRRAFDARVALEALGPPLPTESRPMVPRALLEAQTTPVTPPSSLSGQPLAAGGATSEVDRASSEVGGLESAETASASSAVGRATGTTSIDIIGRFPSCPPASLLNSAGPASMKGLGLSLYRLRTTTMVGRHTERKRLWQAAHDAFVSKTPRAMLIRGERGYGKSRLLRWLCQGLHERGGGVVSATHCQPKTPFDGLGAMVLRQHRLLSLDAAQARRRLSAALAQMDAAADQWSDVAQVILPESGRAQSVEFRSASERYAVLLGYLRLLCQRRPVVVALEDVQWGADALHFVVWLLNRAIEEKERLPLLVVATVEPTAADRRLEEAGLVKDLAAHPSVQTIDLPRFTREEQGELVEALLGLEPTLAHMACSMSDGHPLYAAELVGGWVDRGLLEPGANGFALKSGHCPQPPASLATLLCGRLEDALLELPSSALSALVLAATLGLKVDVSEWRAACAEAGHTVDGDLIERLKTRGLLVRTPSDALAFSHASLRETILTEAERTGELQRCHELCATALASSGQQGRVARHLAAAGRLGEAQRLLLDEARACLARAEYSEARQLLLDHEHTVQGMESIPIASTAERDVLYGELYSLLGERQAADRHLDAAVDSARTSMSQATLARARLWQASLRRKSGDTDAARNLLEEAESLAVASGDDLLRADCLRDLGRVKMLRGELEQARQHFQHARALYDDLDEATGSGICLHGIALIGERTGRLEDARPTLEQARDRFLASGARWWLACSYNDLADVQRRRGELDEARLGYQEAERLWSSIGVSPVFPILNLGLLSSSTGQYGTARQHLERAITLSRRSGREALAKAAECYSLGCLAGLREWSAFDEALTTAEQYVREKIVDIDIAVMAKLGGRLALEAGHDRRAARALSLARDQYRRLQRDELVAEINALLEGN